MKWVIGLVVTAFAGVALILGQILFFAVDPKMMITSAPSGTPNVLVFSGSSNELLSSSLSCDPGLCDFTVVTCGLTATGVQISFMPSARFNPTFRVCLLFSYPGVLCFVVDLLL